MRKLASVVLGAALLGRSGLAQAPDPDEQRATWRFRRSATLVTTAGKAYDFAALALPPELAAQCQPDLRDLRLLGPDGREVQYVIDRVVAREVIPVYHGRLVDTVREKKVKSAWVADLGEPRRFDHVALDVREWDFVKRIRIEVSDDAAAWKTALEDVGIFDREWGRGRVHHTILELPTPVTARYLRLTTDDRRSKPVEVADVVVSAGRRLEGEEWRRPAGLKRTGTEGGVSRYALDLPAGLPLETLVLDSDDPAFYRRVVLREIRERNGRKEEVVLGEAVLYRIRIADESLAGESLELPVRTKPEGGALVLEIYDGDSPPLRAARATAIAAATRMIFPALEGRLTLYYGNEATRAPLYDIETLKGRLGLHPSFAGVVLGGEVENPRFHRALPIPAAAPRGAGAEVGRWKAVRSLVVSGREDLYTLTLAPQDLALLREDLGDLRVVDEQDGQVPFTLEPSASEGRVDLTLERDESPSAREGRATSRYRLGCVDKTSGKPLALPFAAVELTVREGFFSRPARLSVAAASGQRRNGERVLFSGVLARSESGAASQPIVLPLDGSRQGELRLAIDEGDNAPLTLAAARGTVRVPRLAFKAGPGTYRVLLGNPDAAAPRYDIAGLRQEILAYSAVLTQAGDAVPNPAYRRRAGDYFKQAPPTLLLWGALVAAVAVLLALTARILRQPAQ